MVVPREGVEVAWKRNTNVLTIADIEKFGLEKTAEIALQLAWMRSTFRSTSIRSIAASFPAPLAGAWWLPAPVVRCR
jgi:hypothetical protein